MTAGQDAAFEPCDCPEAEFLRELLAVANADGPVVLPDVAFWRSIEHMADVIAARMLRNLSHDVSALHGWGGHPGQPAAWTADDVPDWASNGRSTSENLATWER